jgi:hypothetical protein
MTHTLRSLRLLGALALLGVFNGLAMWLAFSSATPMQPWLFAAWFLGDAIVGLIALGLTE